jgi:hypothetical protein
MPCGVSDSDLIYELVPSGFLVSVVSFARKSANVLVISMIEIPSNFISDVGATGASGISTQFMDTRASRHMNHPVRTTLGNAFTIFFIALAPVFN